MEYANNNVTEFRFCRLIKQPDPAVFTACLCNIDRLFMICSSTCPVPLATPGLFITPEIRCQSEFYMPLKQIKAAFYLLYRQALAYPPVFASSPFHSPESWADCYNKLPEWLQFSANPACLLRKLLADPQLLHRFIFHSFMPPRFNGAGFGRYPGQLDWLKQHLASLDRNNLKVLDIACGSGEGTWEIAGLLCEAGWKPENLLIEGWSLEPLEIWAAANRMFPCNSKREEQYRQYVQPLLLRNMGNSLRFSVADLFSDGSHGDKKYDLVVCNGLLGGPIINSRHEMTMAAEILSGLLLPGGTLVLANRFHDGWKKRIPEPLLENLFKTRGLTVEKAGEGLACIKSYT